jgi:hypothetical protein
MYYLALLWMYLFNVCLCADVKLKLVKSIDEALTESGHSKLTNNLIAENFSNVANLRWHQSPPVWHMNEEAWYALNVDKSFKASLNAVRSVLATTRSGTGLLDQYQVPRGFCPYERYKAFCDRSYPYRMIDGTCNNLENPRWGMSKSPFKRLLHAAYEDSVNEPRSRSYASNRALPNPRLVAMSLHSSVDTTGDFTNLLPHFNDYVHHVTRLKF